jgi:hypothetical protein
MVIGTERARRHSILYYCAVASTLPLVKRCDTPKQNPDAMPLFPATHLRVHMIEKWVENRSVFVKIG